MTVVVEDATERITITGSCICCTGCCRPPAFRHPDFLVDYTVPKPGYPITDGHCRYLTEVLPDGRQLCKIRIAVDKGDTSGFPEEHVAYWKKCCRDWPGYDGKILVKTLKYLISVGCFDRCGFSVALEPKE